jgi:hypothetical protein
LKPGEPLKARLNAFGLDKPRAEVTVSDGKTTRNFFLGADAPDNTSVYVYAGQNKGTVYLIAKNDANFFLCIPFSYISKQITPAIAQSEEFNFSKITLTGGGRSRPIVIVEDKAAARGFTGGSKANPYFITSPVNMPLDRDLGQRILRSIFGLQAAEVEGIEEEPAQGRRVQAPTVAGFASVNVENVPGIGSFTLNASEPDASDNVLLTMSNSPVVYKIAARNIPWLRADYYVFMDKYILMPWLGDIKEVDVSTAENTVHFLVHTSKDVQDLSVAADGKKIDDSQFRKFYQTLLLASYTQDYAGGLPQDAKKILEIRYNYNTSRVPDTVSFYTSSTTDSVRRVLASLNGGKPFIALRGYTDRVSGDMQKLLKGEDVETWM